MILERRWQTPGCMRADQPKPDTWAMPLYFGAGVILLCVLGGVILPLVGQWWGLIFLGMIPLFVWGIVRGWRAGHRP